MSIRQRIAELIRQWDGSDATDRDQKSKELVSEIIRLTQPGPAVLETAEEDASRTAA